MWLCHPLPRPPYCFCLTMWRSINGCRLDVCRGQAQAFQISAQHPLNTTVPASGRMHCDRHSSAPYPLLNSISCASNSKQRWHGKALSHTSASGLCWVSGGLVTPPRRWGDNPCTPNHIMQHLFECLPPGVIHSWSWGEETLLHNSNNSKDVKGTEKRREKKDSSKVLALPSLHFFCCFQHVQLQR